MQFKTYFLAGGAGFIGSHLIDALLKQETTQQVTVYDNFTVGKEWHYAHHVSDKRLSVIKGDVNNKELLVNSMQDHEVVIHLASNSDISQAATNPGIDFTQGMYLTFQVLEAARLTGVKRIIFTSGSGVYGDLGESECIEHQGSLHPVSPYGASKLGGEAFISSYCQMFNMTACVFRFGNVVGPRQTHGVGYDFIRSLLANKNKLRILGNGKQSKSYVYIDDVVDAILLVNQKLESRYDVYNVATNDYITVEEIAKIITECLQLQNVIFEYTGGDRGWNGDVPIVRLNTDKIRRLGWICKHKSGEAIRKSAMAMIAHLQPEVSHVQPIGA